MTILTNGVSIGMKKMMMENVNIERDGFWKEEIGLCFPFFVLFPQHAFADKFRCVQLLSVAAWEL